MDFIHTLLSFVAYITTAAAFFFLTPPYTVFKYLRYISTSISKEDVTGKAVLIVGASSGVGERGARLVLAARREKSLREVADTARSLGAPEAIAVPGDVSNIDDCERLIEETIKSFWTFESFGELCWSDSNEHARRDHRYYQHHTSHGHKLLGIVYMTYLSIPYLRRSKGKIVVIASSASWMPASKAAVVTFYELLRMELGSEVGITIVTPGLTESEMTQGKIINKDGEMVVDQDLRDAEMSIVPIEMAATAARSIVDSACRGDAYMAVPWWVQTTVYWVAFFPEMVEWVNRWFLFVKPGASPLDAPSKKLLDVPGLRRVSQPSSVWSSELKDDYNVTC